VFSFLNTSIGRYRLQNVTAKYCQLDVQPVYIGKRPVCDGEMAKKFQKQEEKIEASQVLLRLFRSAKSGTKRNKSGTRAEHPSIILSYQMAIAVRTAVEKSLKISKNFTLLLPYR